MKKIILLFAITILAINPIWSQAKAKKPTIMVVPSDVWCFKNGFMTEYENQGLKVKYPDYRKALQEDADLLLVISKINGLMAERGFPLKNLESVMKKLESNSAANSMNESKDSGSAISENPMDQLSKTAKADIIMQLTWTVNSTGPKKSITFNLQGLDAYTSKQIATAAGTGAPSFSAELPVLLEEAVLSHLDNYNSTLQAYFDDLFINGREVIVRVQKWDDWDYDLESTFGDDDDEIGVIIEDWLSDNTVEGRFSTTDASENEMLFEQVRMPLFYERKGKQRANDTRRYIKGLAKILKSNYEIDSKVMTKGLGEAWLILGSK